MKDTELKQLKEKLWHAADILRQGAHLAANKYGQPILGLIFLPMPTFCINSTNRKLKKNIILKALVPRAVIKK